MAKQSDKRTAEEKARRKLAKAQLDLYVAQEKRARAMTRGEHEVERARQRAAVWLAKATERVERAAGAVARAEARVLTLSTPEVPRSSTGLDARSDSSMVDLTVESPEAAADVIEQLDSQQSDGQDGDSIIVPESVEVVTKRKKRSRGSSDDGAEPQE